MIIEYTTVRCCLGVADAFNIKHSAFGKQQAGIFFKGLIGFYD